MKRHMKAMHQNWGELANDCVQVALVCGTIGIALKFVTFFNHWVYFPTFPNVIDSAFLITSILYLAAAARRRNNKMKQFYKNYRAESIHFQANLPLPEEEEKVTAQ
ncbi:MAG: hypothetical protein ACQCN5_10620 [Candidatus Bathyarchaeia archaeon]|jgi:hypothetical protein